MSQPTKCAHPACNCNVTDGEKYCSPYCDDGGDEVEIACDCGHQGCEISESAQSRS